jgi:hemoglobin
MLKDINSRDDIKILVDAFYEKIKKDQTIGLIFTEKLEIDWEKHLPIMYNFWDNILFYSGAYTGNPMVLHQHIHEKIGLTKGDFDKWIEIFIATTDELFAGDYAETIKQRARSIATVMQLKILHNHDFTKK